MMTRTELYIRLLIITVGSILIGFCLGMIVAGHSNLECIGEGTIC